MNTHPVQCRSLEEVQEVIQACQADGWQFSVKGLLVTFWK